MDELEIRGIKVTGRTQFLLVPYECNKLLFEQAICFDLENDENKNKIESTKLFSILFLGFQEKQQSLKLLRKESLKNERALGL